MRMWLLKTRAGRRAFAISQNGGVIDRGDLGDWG